MTYIQKLAQRWFVRSRKAWAHPQTGTEAAYRAGYLRGAKDEKQYRRVCHHCGSPHTYRTDDKV